jgi:hypothetical protein
MKMKDGELKTKFQFAEKFSDHELRRILSLVRHELPNVYVLPFCMSIYQVYKHRYMVSSTIVMLIFIFGFDWPIISFFTPLIPIIFINVFALIESNIITLKMNKVHNQLISENIQIQWDELMDIIMVVLIERYLQNEDDSDDNNKLNTI